MARLISRQEAAKLLDVHPQTITNWVDKGILRGHKVDRFLMVDRKSIEQYFDEFTQLGNMDNYLRSLQADYHHQEKELNDQLLDVSTPLGLLGNDLPRQLFCSIFDAVLSVAGQSVLSEREKVILRSLVLDGQAPLTIGITLGITRTRVMQVAMRACRKLARMKSFSDLRQDNKRLKTELSEQNETIRVLCNKTAQLQKELDSYNSMISNLEDVQDINTVALYKGEPSKHTLRSLMSSKIYEFDFSVRCLNCLKTADINTIGDLVRHSMTDILKLRNFGKKTLRELTTFMQDWNLSWDMDVDSMLLKDELINNKIHNLLE